MIENIVCNCVDVGFNSCVMYGVVDFVIGGDCVDCVVEDCFDGCVLMCVVVFNVCVLRICIGVEC